MNISLPNICSAWVLISWQNQITSMLSFECETKKNRFIFVTSCTAFATNKILNEMPCLWVWVDLGQEIVQEQNTIRHSPFLAHFTCTHVRTGRPHMADDIWAIVKCVEFSVRANFRSMSKPNETDSVLPFAWKTSMLVKIEPIEGSAWRLFTKFSIHN